MNTKTTALLIAVAASCLLNTTSFADWPQFRGPGHNAVVADANLPKEFGGESNKNVAWKIDMPGRSVGGAIVIGDQVITTSSGGLEERRCYVTSVDKETGKRNWQQEIVARGRPYCHPTSANAAPTPCSDGERVFAFFSSNDMVCLDLDGGFVWYRSLASDFPKAGNDVGMSSSPVVADGIVVVQVECQGDSFAIGLDTATGKTAWKNERPKDSNWASPTLAQDTAGNAFVVLQCRANVAGFDLQTGKELWSLDIPCSSISSSICDGNRLFACSQGITAVDFSSDNAAPAQAWNNNKLSPNSSSPLLYDNKILCVNRSVLLAGDTTDGKMVWRVRLPDAGSIWATPIIASDTLYLFTAEGDCFVVDLSGDKPKVLEKQTLADGVLGSPAVDGNAMFVRSTNALWKIAATN